ncbi:putative membrane protein YhdT [Bisgaardia hudsonensis]|uniref:Putative membrane protein YhdT n=1 Tax=Bisgaardia hudsonensis TaxID=109472 RepID=A0A4R2MV14_9PAST|nr:DUF997 family protein [Bisgaardia hudsonensis]QLB13631.1 hypothetical protein A6A11_08435 [Bisgaardia hudsonensis]TCP11963.1 putative membrane protein YhdT [Bisgaardia hudsonensis]
MKKDPRYKQASKEAVWAFLLTVLYAIGWCVCAYLPSNTSGLFDFPLWFELSCIYLPVVFVVVMYWVIKLQFKEINLDNDVNKENK